VLGYSPLKSGIVFLPMTLAIVIGSTIASRITLRVGAKRLLILGMGMLTVGLALFTRIGVHSDYVGEMLAPGLIASFGMPFAFIPATIGATTGVDPREAGLASAVANTARLFGGALGLAILATLATTHSNDLLRHPTLAVHTVNQALVSGFQLSFWIASGIAAFGILVATFGMPSTRSARVAEQVAEPRRAVAVEM